ncbi:cation transporter [candidate division KSB1 bacterium]|nr:cation transporter [candidate division KSB1 bacterium]MBL7093849.1 cation transporter [candidate division KSB1 bacterium]
MNRTTYKIEKMDCPSEEQIIRMKLDGIKGIQNLEFNIPERMLTVHHEAWILEVISGKLDELDFNSSVHNSQDVTDEDIKSITENIERKLLLIVLAINFGFFVIEMVSGLISNSMGLIADSLDMFADASVYGLSLYVVGKTIYKKKLIAKLSGYFQLTLAILGFSEVIRRFLGFEAVPDFRTMIIVSIFALIGNAVCLYLLQKSKSEEAHMKASMIFTSNDIIVNSGVIAAGILVSVLNTKIPDLVIGAVVFTFVIRGAFRIIKIAR